MGHDRVLDLLSLLLDLHQLLVVLVLLSVYLSNVLEEETVISDEVKPSLGEEVNDWRNQDATDHKHHRRTDPVEDHTPGDHTEVEAQTEDLENAIPLVSEVVVDLSFEVMLLSVEDASDVQNEEDREGGEQRQDAHIDEAHGSAE